MSLLLQKIYDPRDNLQRIRRRPLAEYVRVNHPELYKHNMPADIMRALLRQNNIHDISTLPKQQMGQSQVRIRAEAAPSSQNLKPQEKPKQTDPMTLLKEEFERVDYSSVSWPNLKKLAKARGIKIDRKDKRPDVERKLRGDPA